MSREAKSYAFAGRSDEVVATSDQEDFDEVDDFDVNDDLFRWNASGSTSIGGRVRDAEHVGNETQEEALPRAQYHTERVLSIAAVNDGPEAAGPESQPAAAAEEEEQGEQSEPLKLETQGESIAPSSPASTIPFPSSPPPAHSAPPSNRSDAGVDSDDDIDMLSTRRRRRVFEETQEIEASPEPGRPFTPTRQMRAGSLPPVWPSPEPADLEPENVAPVHAGEMDLELAGPATVSENPHEPPDLQVKAAATEPPLPRRSSAHAALAPERSNVERSQDALDEGNSEQAPEVERLAQVVEQGDGQVDADEGNSYNSAEIERFAQVVEHGDVQVDVLPSADAVPEAEADPIGGAPLSQRAVLGAEADPIGGASVSQRRNSAEPQDLEHAGLNVPSPLPDIASFQTTAASQSRPSPEPVQQFDADPTDAFLVARGDSPEILIPARPTFSRSFSQMSTTSSSLSDAPESLHPPVRTEPGPSLQRNGAAGAPPSPRTAAALEEARREHQAQQSRSLRNRNPSQLNPYQIEAQRYAAALLRNDWEDALVGQRSVRAQEMRRLADEDRAAKKSRSKDAIDGGDSDNESPDWLIDDMAYSDDSAYTEVSDGHGGKKRQSRPRRMSVESLDKENMSPTKRKFAKERKERKEASDKRRQEKMPAIERPPPATVHHPGIKRARPVAPPIRARSPPRRPTEDLSYLLPRSDDEVDFGSNDMLNQRDLPAFMRGRRRDGNGSDSDSSSAPVLTGIKRKRIIAADDDDSSNSLTSDNDLGATSGIQPTGLFDDFSVDEARMEAMRRGGSSHAQKKKTQGRNNDNDESDSDSGYRHLFKDLRRMMPFHMAKKYIQDVKNMRKGKAYHSDGHVSSTPEPSSGDEAGRASSGVDRNQRSTPATSPLPESEEVRPGEARKRTGPRNDQSPSSSRFALVGDPDASSSDEHSVISVSSNSSVGRGRRAGPRDSDTDVSDRDNSWWTRPNAGKSFRPRKPKDSIDLLLSRAGGQKKAKRKRAGAVQRGHGTMRQSRLDSTNIRRMPAGFGKVAPDNRGGNRPQQGPSKSHKRFRQSRLDVVREQRPAIDLLDDDTLFEFDMPAQRDDEFAFLSPAKDAEVSSDGRDAPAAGVSTSDALPPLHAPSMPGPLHDYMQRPVGPLTPATTAAGSFASVELDRRNVPQPIRIIPPGLDQSNMDSRRFADSAGSHVTPARVQASGSSGPIEGVMSSPAIQQQQHMDAETWASYRRLRVDFGIRPLPFGLTFAASSYLGRGRLAKVLQVSESEPSAQAQEGQNSTLPQSVFAMGMELRLDANVDDFMELLPSLFDAMCVAILPEAGDAATSSLGLRSSVEASLSFIGQYLTESSQTVNGEQFGGLFQAVKTHLYRICDRLQVMSKLGSDAHATASLALRWFAVEYAWRALVQRSNTPEGAFSQADYAAELSIAAQHLMLYLCKHGLHRTFGTIRGALSTTNEGHVLADLSAELWICLIHLLRRVGAVAPEAERLCSFWSVFEATNKVLVQRGVGRHRFGASERTWYSIFVICALSQFGPAGGMTGETPALTQHWPLVTFALSLIRFRFDEKTEKTMSSTSVQRRDAYIRVVLQRCLTLATKWGWRLDNADITMSKLFDIFNSHKLCNLPSEIERTHDYPAFLCKYDESCLKDLTPEDLGEGHGSGRPLVFHVFVKLLARAAYDLRAAAANAAEAERKVSRLFSRMSPVRTMPFTKTSPPTSLERSILFNHYTMVLLYLLFVPSAASQRLRQIRSFLPFPGADIASQMTCIRAMLYIGVLFRHHDLPLQPVTTWFSEALPMLVQQHEALERQRLSGSKTGPYKDWTATAIYRELRSTSTLLIAALRAIQHVLKHPSLNAADSAGPLGFPDLQLLQADWIKTVLEGQVAIDPAIGREAMNTIQEFLKQRNQVIAASQSPKARSAPAAHGGEPNEESQDSFAGMFDDDDMLMDDPLLASMLGEVSSGAGPSAAQTTLNAKDADFAVLIKGTISPALFRLLSNVYHPDRAKAGKRISLSFDNRLSLSFLGRPLREQRMLLEQQRNRQRYVELIVDCWAGCADVLVRNGLRDWDKYFSAFGDESWKRISDPIGRRDVGLRFLNTALLRDPAAYEMYEAEFVSMWYQATVSRLLSIQDKFTKTVLETDGDGPFFRNMPWARDPETDAVSRLRDTDFVKHRLAALLQGFDNMSQEFARPAAAGSNTHRKPMIFACMSATVAAMRQNVEDTPVNHPDRQEYLRFCLKVVKGMKERLGPGILRGAGAEINAFETNLLSLGAKLLSTAEEAAARKAQEVDAALSAGPAPTQPEGRQNENEHGPGTILPAVEAGPQQSATTNCT
ncbi:unnamed protein product [Tilletia laevis]|uniref:Uncharacterized protein n=2 Tax=Tilletia TaxID=13289 RepID=A0A177UGA3_9BASI|nr:hypothetical protein CF336_g3520 [Tilletia laevis]KAE8261922.1 hypothetical protein A4X03_0g2861 [Tilletia caries]CAD6907783.1 unnamed protein product [Tilletia controversa]KAE8204450.1 hypothetical protein CF335_g2653 [Tilletia laevis]CAD6892490.1 unnamed protein product [Tilletia caries]